MYRHGAIGLVTCLALAANAFAQGAKGAGPKLVMNDIKVTVDSVYTGTMSLGVAMGKVTGKLHLTSPTEVLGDVSGTSKSGVMLLEFPYRMTERNCEGSVKMTINVPPKPGPAAGTMEATGCGREPGNALQGTVELTPQALKPKK